MRSEFCSLPHSQVSKNDNLAGIAVKYGISVSDIKKGNVVVVGQRHVCAGHAVDTFGSEGARYTLISTSKKGIR